MSYIPRLKKEYKSNVVTRLIKEFSYDNVMQVPKLEKIVISKGVGAAVNDKKLIDHALNEVTEISGQKAIATMSKKDVASFKLRKGKVNLARKLFGKLLINHFYHFYANHIHRTYRAN